MRVSPVLVTGLLALVTFWLARPGHREEQHRSGSQAAPGYYFEDATLDETDEQGRTNLTLHTRHAVEDSASHSIRLADIAVSYQAGPDSMWNLRADNGTMPLGSDILTLRGHVELHTVGTRAAGAVVLTDLLALDRSHRIASTPELAHIEWPPHQLFTKGLHIDLTRKTLVLENSVHGTFRR